MKKLPEKFELDILELIEFSRKEMTDLKLKYNELIDYLAEKEKE